MQSSGNSNYVWYVDLSQNPLAPDESIDGTCFLFIDDIATGPDSPGYVLNFISPPFNVTPYTTVTCEMDVHFRFGTADYLEIIAFDGVTESVLARFDQGYANSPGSMAANHFSLRHDLALVSQSDSTRIILRYGSPDNSQGRYAGIDNIHITGSGTGVNVLRQAFNTCAQPAGWETEIVSGPAGWNFGRLQPGSSAHNNGRSMDGSCFVYFDDDAVGDSMPASTVRLYTPWFDGDTFFHYILNMDLVFRYSGAEHFAVYLQRGPTDTLEVFRADGHYGGPYFPEYDPLVLDLSAYRSPELRLIFEYADGGKFGYWAGIDNVKVTANGVANEFCYQAKTLLTGDTCHVAGNWTAVFDGPPTACSDSTAGTLWFAWQADFTGIARLSTSAGFNDVLEVYTGSCTNLQALNCTNRDEHGFDGEINYLAVQADTTYLIRVSGQTQGFGLHRGNLCIAIDTATAFPPQPANDACADAILLTLNNPCPGGNNRNAGTADPLPSLNTLARADVWYTFTAGSLGPNEYYELHTGADFSNIITLYEGGCANLQEVSANHWGNRLALPALTNGQTYHVQINGNFAIIEGDLCPELTLLQRDAVPNDSCFAAVEVIVDGACEPGDNSHAGYSGYRPSCVVLADQDIWYKFTAPASGAVHLDASADFQHTVALWAGDCDSLTEYFCARNPQRCDGPVTASGLFPGTLYYVQIAAASGTAGHTSGTVCLKITDGGPLSGYEPLRLTVLQPCIGEDSVQLQVLASGGTPPYTFGGNPSGQILVAGQTFQVLVSDSTGCEQHETGMAAPCTAPCSLAVAAVKVFLQGPYVSAAQLMHDSLRVLNLIPLTEPYSGLTNFSHTGGGGGEETTVDVLALSGPDAIVDWVFLELRSEADPTLVLATRSALLQRDGDVVDVDGVSPVEFGIPADQAHYIVVRHRNHLGAQSGVGTLYPDCVADLDFSNLPPGGFYDYNGLNPAQKLLSGTYQLWAGNGRIDYQLKYNGSNNDRTSVLAVVGLSTPNAIVSGYLKEDYNLDGKVKYNGSANDRNVLLGNVGITTPLAILHDQIAR